MTQDEIIEMAREAGINYRDLSDEFATGNGDGVEIEQMQAFAKLVAAKAFQDGYEKGVAAFTEAVNLEREACAEIAEKQRYAMFISLTSHPAQNGTAVGIANAIRARGEA
jgi:hypothetical protein